MNSDKQVDAVLKALKPQITAMLEAAYQAGQEDMRTRILDMAGSGAQTQTAPTRPAKVKSPKKGKKARSTGKRRAPRGAARALIAQVLAETPDLPGVEVENRVMALDGRIARRTIGNELRTNDGTLYNRGPDGRSWRLADSATEQGG